MLSPIPAAELTGKYGNTLIEFEQEVNKLKIKYNTKNAYERGLEKRKKYVNEQGKTKIYALRFLEAQK